MAAVRARPLPSLRRRSLLGSGSVRVLPSSRTSRSSQANGRSVGRGRLGRTSVVDVRAGLAENIGGAARRLASLPLVQGIRERLPAVQLIPEALIHKPVRQALILRGVMPLAAIGSGAMASSNPLAAVLPSFLNAVANFVAVYSYLIIFRIFLTWFPNFDWKMEPFNTIAQLTDPFLNVFRGLLPPIANIDFTPIFGIMVLQWLMGVLSAGSDVTDTEWNPIDEKINDAMGYKQEV